MSVFGWVKQTCWRSDSSAYYLMVVEYMGSRETVLGCSIQLVVWRWRDCFIGEGLVTGVHVEETILLLPIDAAVKE